LPGCLFDPGTASTAAFAPRHDPAAQQARLAEALACRTGSEVWCWAARHAADLEDAAADLELNLLFWLIPQAAQEVARFAQSISRYRGRLLRGAERTRAVAAAATPPAQADAAGPNPDLFFFAPLGAWADEDPDNERAARALGETLLARAGVTEVRADWPEATQDLLYGCAWFVGRHRWFPEPVEITRASSADRLLHPGWYQAVMREAVAAADRDRQPRIGLAVLNALYALADRIAEQAPDDMPPARGRLLRAVLLFQGVGLGEQLALDGEVAAFDAVRRMLETAISLCEVIIVSPNSPDEHEEAVNLLGLSAARRAGVSGNDPAAGRAVLARALAVVRDTPAAPADLPRRREREAELLVRLCHLDVRDRRFDEVAEHLQRATTLAGPNPGPDLAERLRHHQAKVHVLRGDYDAAEQCFFPQSSGEDPP
jgi:hypothetical protein